MARTIWRQRLDLTPGTVTTTTPLVAPIVRTAALGSAGGVTAWIEHQVVPAGTDVAREIVEFVVVATGDLIPDDYDYVASQTIPGTPIRHVYARLALAGSVAPTVAALAAAPGDLDTEIVALLGPVD